MAKYIDADRLCAEIEKIYKSEIQPWLSGVSATSAIYDYVLPLIDSLQQEQPDFPTTDEEIERFLTTHPKVEVPNKYKTPDWLWKKQEQPEVDLEKEIEEHVIGMPMSEFTHESEIGEHWDWAREEFRYFFELGLNARKEENK